VTDEGAIATAPGSRFQLAFSGDSAVLHFDTEFLSSPPPHLWISLDGGAMIEVPVDRHLRIQAGEDGNHVAEVILKSSITYEHRWYSPLNGRLEFVGWDGVAGELPKSEKKTIEFVGDSITEGVFVDDELGEGLGWRGRPYQDDVTATYAWLTAKARNLEPIISAYGGVGVTQPGGTVPKAPDMYPYCFDGAPIAYSNADYIVMNYGANDREHSSEEYLLEYRKLLDLVATHNPASKLILLAPFCGAFEMELERLKDSFTADTGRDITLIKTRDWIPLEPLHPSREGHRVLAERLTEIFEALRIG
jgi:lysophospholipase L1-like esterase